MLHSAKTRSRQPRERFRGATRRGDRSGISIPPLLLCRRDSVANSSPARLTSPRPVVHVTRIAALPQISNRLAPRLKMPVTPFPFNETSNSNRRITAIFSATCEDHTWLWRCPETGFANDAPMSHDVLLDPHVTLPGNALAASRTQSARAAQRHLTRKDQETNECAGR